MDFGGEDEIRFERMERAGVITLTRPKALNALTHKMVNAMHRALDAWAIDPGVSLVIVKAEGRAFCAGGDILAIYESGRTGNPPVDFFADEYRLNAKIARFPKPYVALIDGIVMGGGVGVSFHGSHRIMTEKAQFAMPEVGIGFFPDVGGSHLLPDLGGSFGMYLGLTGTRIGDGDALWSGLATHTVPSEYLQGLFDELIEGDDIGSELREVFKPARRKTDEATLQKIAKHFSRNSLDAVVRSLEKDAASDPFAAETLALLQTKSPTSLHVAFREITTGSNLTVDECMKMEFRIVSRMLHGHDFYEGIRAAVIDKGDKPQWTPAQLADVDPADIDAYFAPLPRELDL